ncbi:MAG: hypothetical protein RBR03_09110 [Desulfuromonas thiophila]|nr:hypothetical protein [Desulfuromonas thiophila]
MANTDQELKLIINAYTQGVEAGIKKVQDDLSRLRDSTGDWGRELNTAANALDVRPAKAVQAEVQRLRDAYATLKNSGKLSQQELATAAQNLKTKTAELRGQQDQANASFQRTSSLTSSLTGNVTRLAAAYLSWRTVASLYSGITTAAREAETAQFGLTASVEAASREFTNTGGLDAWQAKVRQLSADLRIYSETDVANAASRTIDMTKRLGLSAEQMEELIRRTADLSAGKTDLEGGIERVTAALRGEAEASEFLGLTLNETYVKSWYEANAATEKAWKDLTDTEKAQIRYQVVLEQTAATQGRAAASVTTYSGALDYVKAQVSNAIASNDDLAAALQRVATLLADNADEIADFAASLTSALGHVIEFTLQNKELIGVLIGSGGLISLTASLTSNIGAIGGALKTLGGVKLPDILSPAGGINAALTARIGLYGTLAATLVATVAEYHAMRDAQAEAAAAEQRYQDSAARAQGIAQLAAEQTGLQIDNIQQLNQLLREGVVVRDQLSGAYRTQAQAASEAAAAAQFEAELTEQRSASAAELTRQVAALEQQYGDLSTEALNAAAKQELLDSALIKASGTIGQAEASVRKLEDSFFDAALALRDLTSADADYEAALKTMEQAESAYVAAATRLRDQKSDSVRQALNNEERELELSLDARLIALEDELNHEYLSQRQWQHEKLLAEQQHAEAVLELRRQLYAEAAQLYGEDSQQAIEALQNVREAENGVTAATRATEQAFIGLREESRKAGEEGRKAGRAGREGMDEYRKGVELTKKELSALRQEQSKLQSEAKKTALAKQTGATADAISDTIKGLTTVEALQQWAQSADQQGSSRTGTRPLTNAEIMAGADPGDQVANAMNRYARDLFLEQQKQLELAAAAEKEAQARALRQQIAADQQAAAAAKVAAAREAQAAAAATTTSSAAASSTSKTMTVNLKAGSAAAAVSLPQTDAGKLLDVLKQAGMTTA